MVTTDPTKWIVTETPVQLPEKAVNRHSRLTVAHVTLPDGVQFEQTVMRVAPAAMCVLVDDQQRVLMTRRHRFVPNLWVWELPGGYLDEDEDPAACAAREAEEEAGWRPTTVEHLCTFQPMTGNADALNHVYLGLNPTEVSDQLDINETAETRWIPLDDVPALVGSSVLGAASVIGLLAARERLAARPATT
jgi:8-oxo-dGTP pyrophosphatase MutT (NUDIX family)